MRCGDATPAPQAGDFTLVLLPDTQQLSRVYPEYFNSQTKWIADHQAELNIRYVLHLGDITDNNNELQWGRAKEALGTLDDVVPYALALGNHDYGVNGNAATRESLFNSPKYFGPGSAYGTQPTVGGFYEEMSTDNSYHIFRAGDRDWLVLMLELGPRDPVAEWANEVLSSYPEHHAILVTHAYLNRDGELFASAHKWSPNSYAISEQPGGLNNGEQLWEKLVSRHGFVFVFCGHELGDGTAYRKSIGIENQTIQPGSLELSRGSAGLGGRRPGLLAATHLRSRWDHDHGSNLFAGHQSL